MRWETKALALAVLSVAPFGSRLYRRLQDALGTSRLDVNDDYGYGSKPVLIRILREHGIDLTRSDVLEIGTGWHGVLPLLLSLTGTRSIATIDLNPWLTAKSLDESLSALHGIADRIEDDLGVPAATTRATLSRMREKLADGADVRDVLRGARITYHAPLNLMQTGWADGSFDVAVSTNVLEHVPPDALRQMQVELRRIVRPGGIVLHYVHPGDHFAADERISTINFLRYSPLAWRLIGGWRLAYHNRLRCVDYVQLMTNGGFRVESGETRLDRRALDAVRAGRIRPHAAFGKYSDVELCEDLITVVARRQP
jgi:SAM-dependent methyltransferase